MIKLETIKEIHNQPDGTDLIVDGIKCTKTADGLISKKVAYTWVVIDILIKTGLEVFEILQADGKF